MFVCICVCVSLQVCACACTHKHARSCVRMGLGLRVWLVMGQPLGLPEACQGSLRQRPDGHLGSWELNVEGLPGHARATQVCRGSQSPCHPPREGLGLQGPNSRDAGAFQARRLAGWLAGRLDNLKAGDGSEHGGVPGVRGRWVFQR